MTSTSHRRRTAESPGGTPDPPRPQDLENLLGRIAPYFEGVDPPMREWMDRYAAGHLDHYRDILRHFGRLAGAGDLHSVLDVGALPGHVTIMLKEAGFAVTAVDVAPERVGTLFGDLDIPSHKVDLDLEPLPFADACFDCALICEVMEHLRLQPVRVLKQIHRVLVPGGKLLLSVPNITPHMRWRFLLGDDYQGDLLEELNKLFTIGHMGHFRLYSRGEIERILRHAGFRITGVATGGKRVADPRWDARLMRRVFARRMRNQLYVCAEKPDPAGR